MSRRTLSLLLIYASLGLLLFVFQPVTPRAAQAQDATSPNPYIDALGTQAALNTQATLAANQQQQAAAQAQVAAAAAQAQAAYVAQQATLAAGQQQAALVAAQSTADAAALQATAIVQQTRTALELSAQQTREASNVRATATAQALQVKATQAALEQTRVAADAQRRDNESISTAVAMSIAATQVAIDRQTRTESAQAVITERTNAITSWVITGVMIVAGLLAVLLIGKFALGVWRSRALNPQPAPQSPLPMTSATSSASSAMVDATTGEIGSRFAIVEHNDDPQALADWLKAIYGR